MKDVKMDMREKSENKKKWHKPKFESFKAFYIYGGFENNIQEATFYLDPDGTIS